MCSMFGKEVRKQCKELLISRIASSRNKKIIIIIIIKTREDELARSVSEQKSWRPYNGFFFQPCMST